ncbi:hypothetical protein C4573_06620 [Candidatus Woesearchaeota archaeon]|nr:MAG: hypothetical protein C4573_06620 [Candidatus Woesearchaeota archaeon]
MAKHYGLALMRTLTWYKDGYISDWKQRPFKRAVEHAFFLGVAAIIVASGYKTDEYYNLEQQVMLTADTNKDGATTSEEWSKVYKSLGIFYDWRNPIPLTGRQLEHYLQTQKDNPKPQPI